MTRRTRSINAVAVLILMGMVTACERDKVEPVELATLPYLSATHDPELRAELARLVAERATPQMLDKDRGKEGMSATANAARIAAEMNEIYPLRSVRITWQRVERFYPTNEFQFDPIQLEKARSVCKEFSPRLERYRKLFRRKGFRCDVSIQDGLLADLSLLDHVQLVHRIEALAAADELSGGHPNGALLPLRNMLRMDACLATVPNVSARLAAARLRSEALKVIAALVRHPRCTQAIQNEIVRIIDNQIGHWTPDSVAWSGDRALGLHAYEMVHDGQLMNILTADEIARMKKAGDLNDFDKAVQRGVDNDELFYLTQMRHLIDACDKPFFARAATFQRMQQRLDELVNTARFPLFAADILLPDLVSLQRAQALDRARCEAWAIGLRAALGESVELAGPNPVTGKPYDLTREDDGIVISGIGAREDAEPALIIPVAPK